MKIRFPSLATSPWIGPAALLASACLAWSGASSGSGRVPATAPAGGVPPIRAGGLHNAHRVTDKVLSGAQPEGEAGFRALAELGVRTILSVDGARPDVEGARKHGLRYVHLPIGYGGVSEAEARALAKALEELPGPVYVHCHHGKHRSAAAVAVGCVLNGSLAPERAEEVLRTFGTGENYRGLWRAAREARPMGREALAAVRVELPETARVTAMAEAMVAVDRHWEHLKLLEKAGWKPVAEHPDLHAAHEALQLAEHLRELGRGEDAARRPEPFRRTLAEAEAAAAELREALAARPPRGDAAAAAMRAVARSCVECHRAHRD